MALVSHLPRSFTLQLLLDSRQLTAQSFTLFSVVFDVSGQYHRFALNGLDMILDPTQSPVAGLLQLGEGLSLDFKSL